MSYRRSGNFYSDLLETKKAIANSINQPNGRNSIFGWKPVEKKEQSLFVEFLRETTFHGCKFLAHEKRHFTERLFWFMGIFVTGCFSVYLIHGTWDLYKNVPIIVTYHQSEQNMDSVPFPAVTFCSMNKFSRSKVLELQRNVVNVTLAANKETYARQLDFVKHICNKRKDFSNHVEAALRKGQGQADDFLTGFSHKMTKNESEKYEEDIVKFLLDYTIPCDKLLKLCFLDQKPVNCTDIFKPLVTEFGKCCTFNMLPLPLMLKSKNTDVDSTESKGFRNILIESMQQESWSAEELEKWGAWDYKNGFVLNKHAEMPWRQTRPGESYGLSVLLDPSANEYFCPGPKVEGVRHILHHPLNIPQVSDFSSVTGVQKEVWVKIDPDMTVVDDDIRDVKPDQRSCYFGTEKHLNHYEPYTAGNCFYECMLEYVQKVCNCTEIHMPRVTNTRVCSTLDTSEDNRCVDATKELFEVNMKHFCQDCKPLCVDIAHNYETSSAKLPSFGGFACKNDTNYLVTKKEKRSQNKMSIVHVYFGKDSVAPKVRKRKHSTTDLIANAGGILGLCLGCSILSGLEIVYFLFVRAFWRYIWPKVSCRGSSLARNNSTQMKIRIAQQLDKRNVDPISILVTSGNNRYAK